MSRRRKGKPGQRKKHSLVTGIQKLYLSIVFFFMNDMWSYASACAFGFLFSFVPVVMLVLVIVIRLFHASPDTIARADPRAMPPGSEVTEPWIVSAIW